MAAGKWNMQKASGGVASITVADGVSNTAVVLPESGTVATTDNIVGFKNYIINGNFDVWQRGTSQTTGGYGSADRWFTQSDGNCTLAYEQVSYNNTAKLSWTSAGTYKNFLTSIEDGARKLQGKTVTMSFMAKAATAGTCFTYVGRGITAGNNVGMDSVSINLTTSWQKITRTFTIPIYDNNNMTLVVGLISMQLLGASNTVWIKEVQFEEGSIATPFENRPYGLELSLCQRYYETGYLYGVSHNSSATAVQRTQAFYKCNKRIVPSITVSKIAGDAILGVSRISTSHFVGEMGSTASSQEWYGTYTADAEL